MLGNVLSGNAAFFAAVELAIRDQLGNCPANQHANYFKRGLKV
jgi:hypothetical protein